MPGLARNRAASPGDERGMACRASYEAGDPPELEPESEPEPRRRLR